MCASKAETDGRKTGADEPPAMLILPSHNLDREDLQEAINNVRRRGFRLDIQATDSVEQTRQLVDRYGCSNDRTLIAGGGDGMLNVFAQSIEANDLSGCTIGVLPLGTGNDFATAGGISDKELETALQVAIAGTPFPVDLAFVNDRPFMNVVTIGQTAEFSRETDPGIKEKLGKWAYAYSAFKGLGEQEVSKVHVRAGQLHWSGSVFGVMVGNGRQAGGGFTLSHTAKVDDGELNGLIIPEMPLRQAALLAFDMKHDAARLEMDNFPVFQAGQITLHFEHEQAMQIDGEASQARDFVFRVDPKRFKIRLPRNSKIVGQS